MENKRICRAKYAQLAPVSLKEAEKYLETYCRHYGLDRKKFVLVTKMPTLQLE